MFCYIFKVTAATKDAVGFINQSLYFSDRDVVIRNTQ